jgi:hypothetical protein
MKLFAIQASGQEAGKAKKSYSSLAQTEKNIVLISRSYSEIRWSPYANTVPSRQGGPVILSKD